MKECYHFLGIGGIGMSALARVLVEKGESVTGTDLSPIPTLEKIGIRSPYNFRKYLLSSRTLEELYLLVGAPRYPPVFFVVSCVLFCTS